MELQDHQTHLQNLVNQANTLSNEIETKRTLLLKVQGVIEYLSELGVKLPETTRNIQKHQSATRTRSL